MVGKFTFATREEGFDQHIEQSIRGYSNLWNDVLQLSRYFVEDHTNVVDIGCSTGKLLTSMIDQNDSFAPLANYNGVEVEEDFYEEWHHEDVPPTTMFDLKVASITIENTNIKDLNLSKELVKRIKHEADNYRDEKVNEYYERN